MSTTSAETTAQTDPLNDLIDEIIKRRSESLKRKISRWPRNQFIASDIGECDRQLVYGVNNWQEREMHGEYLQAIFDIGKEHEMRVLRDLMEDGFEVIGGQDAFEIKNSHGEVIARGKTDGFVKWGGSKNDLPRPLKIPIEIKTMNLNNFNGIRSLESFQKKPLYRKYLRQMQLYLYGNNMEFGLFILTDLQGHYKYIPVYLDYGECELILKRLEASWAHKKAGSLPDRIDYRSDVCGKCPFSHICLPDIVNDGQYIIQNEHFEGLLNEREQLLESASRYKDLDEQAKDLAKEIGRTVILGSDWQVQVKTLKGKRVEAKLMPDDVRKQYEVETEQTRVNFVRLEKAKI